MSIEKVSAAHAHGNLGAHRHAEASRHRSLAHAEPGQEVSLRILSKIGDQRFVASMGDARYLVDSAVSLVVGQTVKATVSAVGGVIELKYLGSGQFERLDSDQSTEQLNADTRGAAALIGLQNKYRIALSQPLQQFVADASNDVQRPEAMAMGALYLNRIGESLQGDALQALYAKQVWGEDKSSPGSATDISALVKGTQQENAADLDALAKILGDAVDRATSTSSASIEPIGNASVANGNAARLEKQNSDSSDTSSNNLLKELAHRVLNQQDAGTLAYHYGSLPVIVANQLVELDLVLFREREPVSRQQGMRKLVMTLRTETLGKVEILAQSLDKHLNVSIAAQSADSIESLVTHAQEVRGLLDRLGWNTDSVSYRLSTEPPRAAEQIVKHVLSAGSLDAVI